MQYQRFDPTGCGFPKPRVPILPSLGWQALGRGGATRFRPLGFDGNAQPFTRGRYALTEAYRLAGVGANAAILLPAYHCRTMLDPAIRLDAPIVLYTLQPDLSPDLAALANSLTQSQHPVKAMLLTHYFGFTQALGPLVDFCAQHDITLIEDCSHALFIKTEGAARTTSPIMGKTGQYGVASPYKFFPCEDGGLLWANTPAAPPLTPQTPQPLKQEIKGILHALQRARASAVTASAARQSMTSDCVDRHVVPPRDDSTLDRHVVPPRDDGILERRVASPRDDANDRHCVNSAFSRGAGAENTAIHAGPVIASAARQSMTSDCVDRHVVPPRDDGILERRVASPRDDGISPYYQPAQEHQQSLVSSRWIMRHTKLQRLAENRRQHYQQWVSAVAGLPHCRALFPQLPADCVPYMFPLHIDHPEIHFFTLKQLGVPIWRWDDMAVSGCAVATRNRLSLLHLPCHQELTPAQMAWMTSTVQQVMRQNLNGDKS